MKALRMSSRSLAQRVHTTRLLALVSWQTPRNLLISRVLPRMFPGWTKETCCPRSVALAIPPEADKARFDWPISTLDDYCVLEISVAHSTSLISEMTR
jgi:hypothetical protein